MNGQSQLADNPYALFGDSVANAPGDVRAAFIRKTYTHLTAAIYAFAALIWLYFQTPIAENIIRITFLTQYGPLIMLGGFMLINWFAQSWAESAASKTVQYAGLCIYVFAMSVVCTPLLYFAQDRAVMLPDVAGTGITSVPVIPAAAITTLAIFGVLTAVAWTSRADFSFLRAALSIGFTAVFILFLASFLFGFHLGVWLSVGMIILMSANILYDTSNVIHKYPADKYVAASLALFASVVMLFYYIVRLFMAFSSDD